MNKLIIKLTIHLVYFVNTLFKYYNYAVPPQEQPILQ